VLPVLGSVLAMSDRTNVLLNDAIPDHTAIFIIGIEILPDVYGLTYQMLIPEVVPPPLTKLNHVYRVAVICGRYARLGPLL
jgi:hypothetical protein